VTASASPSGVQALSFYAISFQSVNSKACGSLAASLIFYFFLIDEIQSRQMKMKHWACNAVAAASYSLMIEVY